jgi:rod shape determining protein RodA
VQSKFHSMLAFGTGSIFFYHSFINIGMAIGLMPVMGIPLPFLSAGGSSLLVNMALIGLLLNAYRTHRKKMKI